MITNVPYTCMRRFLTLVFLLLMFVSCGEDGPIDEPVNGSPEEEVTQKGLESFTNPAEGRVITPSGETITCVAITSAAYEAELILHSGETPGNQRPEGTSGSYRNRLTRTLPHP